MKTGDEITAARNRAAQASYDKRYGRLAHIRRFCQAEYDAAEQTLAGDTSLSPDRKMFLRGRIEGLYVAMSVMPPPPPPSPGPDWTWNEESEGWGRA